MMKVCILGDSHVACLMHGWELIKEDYDQVAITFFAYGGFDLPDSLKVKDRYLVPDNDKIKKFIAFCSGGLEYIAIDSCDHFLISGLGLRITHPTWVYYSTQVQEQSLRDDIAECLAWKLFKKIRSITDQTIYLGHCPLLATETPSKERDDLEPYHNRIAWVNEKLLKDHNVTMPIQPIETIVNGFETGLEYSKGSANFGTRKSHS